MDGSEDKRIEGEPSPEPEYLRRMRNVRTFYDLAFPMVVGVLALVAGAVLLSRPHLRDPLIMSGVGGVIMALGGATLRKRR